MYSRPPLSANVGPAAIVAATNTTVIAAPGAGKAIRVLGVKFGVGRTTTGVSDQVLQDGVGGNQVAAASGLNIPGIGSIYVPIPDPGYQLTVNTLLNLSHATTTAVGNLGVLVYYFIEDVT